ncbi:MAG: ABC transporter ATP-binding protein [Desulfobacteraceae bacterium]|nr:ABC transporter ATP-binding protein [Desulfobacteraceae bacterium]
MDVVEAIFSAKNLSLTYKGALTPSLDQVNLDIMKGELFGLIGPNGAGKTTLISLSATLLKPSSGSLEICGEDICTQAGRIRKLTGLVPQEPALYLSLTGRENLRYYGTLYGIEKNRLNKEIDRHLKLFGLSAKANQRVETYSGGMKRRINLLAGILHRPRLLFLDEPTVGIDAQSRNMIMENLQILNKKGVTIIYTTHYMEEIEKLCKRIAVIDKGRIIAQGNPGRLVAQSSGCKNLSDLFFALTGKRLRD